ncbi:hypothetical protein GOP47_0001048, partial [Adiantum capillus-veneris]
GELKEPGRDQGELRAATGKKRRDECSAIKREAASWVGAHREEGARLQRRRAAKSGLKSMGGACRSPANTGKRLERGAKDTKEAVSTGWCSLQGGPVVGAVLEDRQECCRGISQGLKRRQLQYEGRHCREGRMGQLHKKRGLIVYRGG